RVFTANSTIVDNTGEVRKQSFPPSMAAGDLTGDGLKDLIVADSAGYFWLYVNKGTKKEPKFVRGESLPFWLAKTGVPKLQLIDFNGDGLLDLVVGDFQGRLFYIKNTGTAQIPKFHMANDLKEIEIKTDPKGRYWCNYLAPFLYDWDGDGKLDLIMGEGTFSANSIFVLLNKGTNAQPNFDTPKILISGEGKEHLTPRVIDWNGDGKPDIVTGERDKGTVSVYLNTTVDQKSGPWTFAPPVPINMNATGTVVLLSAPIFEDMNDDGLPDLLMGTSAGNIRMAFNTGKAKDYKFDKLDNIKGESPLPNFVWPTRWIADYPGGLTTPESSRFQLLRALTKNERYKDAKNLIGYEPELDLPKESAGKSCMLFDFVDPKQELITDITKVVLPTKQGRYIIRYPDPITLKPDSSYELTFQVKGNGIGELRVELNSQEEFKVGGELEDIKVIKAESVSVNSTWSLVSKKPDFSAFDKEEKKKPHPFSLSFSFEGEGQLYLDDVTLIEKK
ncbi:MAG: VCBS repeat-containing protein, partial [Verrucomicrobiota bacterium]